MCLGELLDTEPSVGWVNSVLSQAEVVASTINQIWQPQVGETLSGDEIYANGQPNLLLVGNDSLYIYALSRQPNCDGELRPILDGRKHTDQGCLDLFRFLHNIRPFARGKRAGHSPAQLVDLDLPPDPLTLLGLAPKVSI